MVDNRCIRSVTGLQHFIFWPASLYIDSNLMCAVDGRNISPPCILRHPGEMNPSTIESWTNDEGLERELRGKVHLKL